MLFDSRSDRKCPLSGFEMNLERYARQRGWKSWVREVSALLEVNLRHTRDCETFVVSTSCTLSSIRSISATAEDCQRSSNDILLSPELEMILLDRLTRDPKASCGLMCDFFKIRLCLQAESLVLIVLRCERWD